MRKLAKLSLWALAFTPLVVTNTAVYPAVFGKIMLLRVMLLLASGLFFFQYIDQPKFRVEVRNKVAKAIRNPLVLAAVAFVTLAIISTFLAVSPFRAFFGDLERGEGLLGLLCYFAFFAYSYLLFDRQDWITFFKLNIAAGLISVIKAVTEYAGGSARAEAFTGNPEFLAGYLLFVIFCAAIVFINSPRKSFWRYAAAAGGAASLTGIALTQTRGLLLGLAMAAAVLIIYGLIRGKNTKFLGRVSVRTAALVLIVLATAGGGLFLATKDATFWQKIPGVSRIAKADVATANSVKTRLISLKTGWRAATESGPVRGLFGYGPDNFNIAFNRFYDPAFYDHEHGWFDRAHNKLMDVLVMNGALGLLAYLAIWASLLYLVFRRQSAEHLAILLYGVAYFTFLMTVFDQVTTYLPFFAALAFLVNISMPEPVSQAEAPVTKKKDRPRSKIKETGSKSSTDIIALGAVSVALAWIVVVWTFIPFAQQTIYRSTLGSLTDPSAAADIDSVFTPYNYGQEEMRVHFLRFTAKDFDTDSASYELFLKALGKMDEAEKKEPFSAKNLLPLGIAYDQKASITKDKADWKKAEGYYRRALELAPLRQEVVYALAADLVYQGRANEAVDLMRKELAADDRPAETHYYLGFVISKQGENKYAEALTEMEKGLTYFMYKEFYPANSGAVYKRLARYFYGVQDQPNFITVMKRLSLINPQDKATNAAIIKSVEGGSWPEMEIK